MLYKFFLEFELEWNRMQEFFAENKNFFKSIEIQQICLEAGLSPSTSPAA